MRFLLATVASMLLVSCSVVKEITWQKHPIAGQLTGVTAPNAENVTEALGYVENGVFHAPNGRSFKSGTVVDVAREMIDVQPSVARLKEVIGFSTKEMVKHRPESELSNLIADVLILEVCELSGMQVDVSIINMGGIRTDMPSGDILLDDVVSMLPFRNKLCYVQLRGKDLRAIFEQFAREGVQGVGGVRLVYGNNVLVSCEVGGKPLDDNAYYGVATPDFLLDGGDNIFVARNAVKLEVYDELLGEMLEKYIRRLTAEGKQVESSMDGRVIWK